MRSNSVRMTRTACARGGELSGHRNGIVRVHLLADRVSDDLGREDVRAIQLTVTGERPFRHIQIDQFFNRHNIGKVVAHIVHIIEAVAHHFCLEIGLGFHVLFNARVQVTDLRDGIDDRFSVELQ